MLTPTDSSALRPVAPADHLDSASLARRLGELAGNERNVQVDFLLHLDAFDRRRAFLEAGYGSLWEFCLRALHLREGSAGRRIAAMRVLRRFPMLEGALREGRLCLSTLALLGPVLSQENLSDLLARASFRTRAEVDHLVATLQPRAVPKEGLRKLPEPRVVASGLSFLSSELPGTEGSAPVGSTSTASEAAAPATVAVALVNTPPAPAAECPRPDEEVRPAARATVRPVAADVYSLRVTIDGAFKEELEQLRQLLSHTVPDGDLAKVLSEAVHCGIEKHGKRRGAVAPSRKVRAHRPAKPDARSTFAREPIPAEVRRVVWARDGGQCAWRGEDGRRCESRWKLEFDHLVPAALGGPATTSNLRLACFAHNRLYAEQIYGRDHMQQFRRETPRAGETAIAGGSALCVTFAPQCPRPAE